MPTSVSAATESGPRSHDHAECRDKALHAAEHVCADRGVRLTPIRRNVLELIWESHRAVKAYDLLDRLRSLERSAKPATVYRALEFLLKQGLIHRVESLNAFIGCNSSERPHEELLLICSECHEVEERHGAQVTEAVARELEQAGFTLHHKAIEVHGVCAHCTASQRGHRPASHDA